MATSMEGHCAVCQNTTRQHCSRCVQPKNARENPLPLTFYCSTKCQKADYTSHKETCYARQQLFRGATLLKSAFLMFREMAFDMEISNVKVVNGELHVYEPPCSEDAAKCSPLYEFPSHLLSSDIEKEILLSYCACDDALKYMFELTGKVLEGITSKAQAPMEITLCITKSELKVHRYSNGVAMPKPSMHSALMICLKNAEGYVVDLAGAQFHRYDAVTGLDVYADSVGQNNIKKCEPFGHESKRDRKQSAAYFACSQAGKGEVGNINMGVYTVQGALAKAFNAGIEAWESKCGQTVSDMLRKNNHQDYEIASKELLASAKASMEPHIAWLQAQTDLPFQEIKSTKANAASRGTEQQSSAPESELTAVIKSVDEDLAISTEEEEDKDDDYSDEEKERQAAARIIASGAFKEVIML